jgi:hypothetical protein
MSDDLMNHGYSDNGRSGNDSEYEREDLGSRGIFAFMIGLAVSGAVIYFIIVGMFNFLDRYEKSQMTTASPLITSTDPMSRVVTQEDMDKSFKDNGAPMLETNERGQFRDFLTNQENQLNSYGWVDEKAGVAHIPIERAMDLTVQHGLPVYPQGSTGTDTAKDNKDMNTTAVSKTPAQKSPKKGKSSAK